MFRNTLSIVLRVQVSLVIISTYVLPEKIICSLTSIFEGNEKKSSTIKMSSHPIPTFFNAFRVQTCKHKQQKLVLRKNWKNILNRITRFQKKISKPVLSNKISNQKDANKSSAQSQIQIWTKKYFKCTIFWLCVISLPGIITMYLLIPQIQTFTKYLHNFPENWLENMMLSHSYFFSKLYYLYISRVFCGNMAINSFFISLCLEYFPNASGSYSLPIATIIDNF